MVREFTSIPIAIWVMLFVVEISRLGAGRTGYQPFGGPIWIVFSLICLVFALWHSITFLSLAGRIIRIPLGDRYVPPRFIVGAMFGLLFAATILIGALLVLGGR
jgi:fumarate reductase subunit C